MTTYLRGWTAVMGSDAVKTAAAVGSALVLAGVLGTVGWMVVRPDPSSGGPVSAYPAVARTSPAVADSPSVAVRPRPTPATRASVRPRPAHRLPIGQLPPAPKSRVIAFGGTTCPWHAGKDAAKAQVKAALVVAAGRQYWRGAARPADLVGPVPAITVPVNLLEAVAWQESGWQSTIVGCDHGIGTMQLQSTLADWLNKRFATSYDIGTLAGNTALGAAYLDWLTLYFGLYYFGAYDLNATANVGRGGATMALLDVVISAYNVGPAALERDNGTPDIVSDDWLAIPNPRYVTGVTTLMSSCVCTAF